MDAFTLVAKLTLDKEEFDRGLKEAESGATSGSGGLTKWGVAAGQVAANAFSTGFKALSRFTKDAILNSMSFDATMSEVKAVGQMTEEQFNSVRDTAVELGRTTKFTAQEAAQGLYYMAIAGWDANEMIAGIPAVLDLAAASGEDLGTTSDIVTDAMEAFGLGASDTAHFVDVLAAAASNSNTTVGMMGEAFKYVGPVAGTLGYSINDVALGMGLLANQGIKASQAGTSLRQVFSSLIDPSEDGSKAMEDFGLSLYDSNGGIKSFKTLMSDFRQLFVDSGFDVAGGQMDRYREKLSELSDQLDSGKISAEEYSQQVSEITKPMGNADFLEKMTDIFGTRGLTSVLALMKASEESWNQLSESIANSDGMADLMAGTMLDNLKGDITLMQSALQGLQQLIMDSGFTDGLRNFIKDITTELGELAKTFNEGGLAGMFNNLSKWLIDGITETLTSDEFSEGAGQFGKALGDFVGKLVNTLVTSAPELLSGLFEAGMNLAGGLVEGLFSGLFGTQEGSMKYFMDKTQDEQKKAIDEANKTATQAQGIVSYMDSLVQKYGEAAKNTEEWASAMKNLQDLMPDVSDAMSKPVESLGEMVGNMKEYVEQMRQLAVQQAQQDALKSYRDKYAQSLIDLEQNKYAYNQSQSQIETAQDTAYQILKQAYEIGGINRHLFEGNAEGYNLTDSNYRGAMDIPSSREELYNAIEYLQGQGIDFGDWTVDGLVRAYEESQRTAENAAAQMEDLQKGTEALEQEMKIAEQAVSKMSDSAEETGEDSQLFGQKNEFGQTEEGTVDTSGLQTAVDSAASEIDGMDADLDTSGLQGAVEGASSSVSALGESAAGTDVSGYQAGLDTAGAALSAMASGASIDTSGLQSAIAAAASALAGLASAASSVDFSGLSGGGAISGMAGPMPVIRTPGRHAKGAWDIPFDDYPALLHRGEMVLTASQARRFREGSGGGFDPSAMYQAVAMAVESAVAQIQIKMDSMAVGNAVTKQVSKNIYREQYGRRYATL